MTANRDDVIDALTGKLQRLATLDKDDRKAIAALPFTTETVPSGYPAVLEGARPARHCLLVDGYAFRHRSTREGSRQILSFHMRGDIVDLERLMIPKADHGVQTITRATIAWIPADALGKAARSRPAIGEALWRDTLIDASIFREWILNVGRRDARTRIAHMLCEFVARGVAAGLGPGDGFELPMTQEQVGDATGLTAVHVNRMLQQLRADGVLARDNRVDRVVHWKQLCAIGGFDNAYLHAAAA